MTRTIENRQLWLQQQLKELAIAMRQVGRPEAKVLLLLAHAAGEIHAGMLGYREPPPRVERPMLRVVS